MIGSFLFIILGFTFLIFGANWLIDGASSLAKKHKVSDLIVGLTIVAFGTSAPELVVNSIASYDGYSDIVIGNIIGSNNFNLFIILGLAGMIFPIAVPPSTIRRDIPISFIAAILVLVLGNAILISETAEISRMDGLLLLATFGFFLFFVLKQMKTEKTLEIVVTQKSNLKIWGLILSGFFGLALGGHFIVTYSISIAQSLGVSEKIIALTILAVGTSLPELVTSIVAARKQNSDIAIGNVIGSNIFNILLVLSVSALIHPIQFNANFNIDLLILLGGTLFLFIAMYTGKRFKLDKWEAALLFVFYLGYTSYLIWKEM
jgi:cation:H+ antiporter